MKNYKLVNSKEVQEKALKLGYDWRKKEDESHCRIDTTLDPFLFTFAAYECIATCNLKDWEDSDDFEEITQKDFLALPEPLIVGDWVKSDDSRGVMISKVTWVSESGDQLETNNIKWCLEPENCTKLTPEQIKILGLEE